MAAIRSLFEHFNAREKALGLTRGSSAWGHADRARLVAAAAFLGLVLAIIGMAVLLARTVALPVRRVARAAARLGAGELSARVPEQAEIGDLARTFSTMATPLTSIVGYLELLREDDVDLDGGQALHFLEVIERNAIRLQRLVDDVLFAARAESGRLGLATGAVDLAAVARESVEAARPKAEERGVALFVTAERMPDIAGDRDRLGQALDNLISNALKFTPPGGQVELCLRAGGGRALVEVRDTGLGMSEIDCTRVFDRFFRAAATRDHTPGVGLGLTIVVEGHGGAIDVTSTEGAATTFHIALPLAGAAEHARRRL